MSRRYLEALGRMERRNVVPVRRAFDAGVGAMGRAVARAVRGGGRDPLTRATLSQIVAASTHAATRVMGGAADVLVASTADTLHDALGVLARSAGKLGLGGILDDARQAANVVASKRTVLEAMRRRVMVSNAGDALTMLRARLASVPIDEAKVNDAIDVAVDAIGDQWWRVERVAATEASVAFNAAQDAGMSVLWAGEPKLMKRWTELVSDATGQPLDNRVAQDSLDMHGQLAKPGGSFEMPPWAKSGMTGSWSHPPNRPHDRSVLTPWLPGQGVPGWIVQNGVKRNMR